MTVSEFYKKIAEMIKVKPHLRTGQAAYIISLDLIPTEDWRNYQELDCDPFHDNRKIGLFVEFLLEKGYLQN